MGEPFAALGIDTSNYTTSAAVYRGGEAGEGALSQQRRLLSVEAGGRGLRQSDAVFQHVKALPELIEALEGVSGVGAVGASTRPCSFEGSYMPCFKVGEAAGRAEAAACGAPFFAFTHQAGHIAAALYSIGKLELLDTPFLAFHISGGTTEAVIARPHPESVVETQVVASSLDLKAGQAVDRVGVLLGLPFPCGPALEKLASQSAAQPNPRPVLRGCDISLSGVENQCRERIARGEPPEDIAAFCLEFLAASLEACARAVVKEYPALPVLFAGGVASNRMLQQRLSEAVGARFAAPGFSSDNAAGIAVLTYRRACGL